MSQVKVSLVSTALAVVLQLMRLTADIRSQVDTRSAAQAATSPVMHSEQTNTSSYTPLPQLQDQASGGGAAAKAQEASDESGGRDVDSLGCDHLFGDSAGHKPGEPFGDDGSISAQTTADLLPPPHARKTDGHSPPLDAQGCPLPYIPNRSAAGGDESLPDEGASVQQPQSRPPSGGREPYTARLSEFQGPVAEQDDDSWIDLDVNVNACPGEAPKTTADKIESFAGANAGDAEDNDSDEPVLPSRRRQGQSSARSSDIRVRVFSPSTQRSRSHSTEVESASALPRRKRLRRRKGTRRDSPNPDPDDSSLSTSSGLRSERCPVQCFVQRKMVRSQEMITIELPAFSLRRMSGHEAALSLSDDMRRMTSVSVAGRTRRRRARFSKEEEDLLVELKERKDPKLSWREIRRHFPNRTIGSLQVHYSTQLKGRLRSGGLVGVNG